MILRLLRLRQIHNATFVKVNKAIMNMLQRVQQYVTFGFPNRKTIESLIYKRGYGKVNGQRIRLSDNFIVEIKLNTPKGGYTVKSKSYLNRGTFGNREAQINEF